MLGEPAKRTTTWLWVAVHSSVVQMPWEHRAQLSLAPHPFALSHQPWEGILWHPHWYAVVVLGGKNDNVEREHQHAATPQVVVTLIEARLLNTWQASSVGLLLEPQTSLLKLLLLFFTAANLTPCKGTLWSLPRFKAAAAVCSQSKALVRLAQGRSGACASRETDGGGRTGPAQAVPGAKGQLPAR